MLEIKNAMMKRMVELDFHIKEIEAVKYDYSDILDENIDIIFESIDNGMTLESAISYVLEVITNENDDDYDEDEYYDYY